MASWRMRMIATGAGRKLGKIPEFQVEVKLWMAPRRRVQIMVIEERLQY